MIPINRTYAPLQALVDELARCGMRHAVTSPGSRNAPISLTLADDDRIDAVSVVDERAAGFMALGMAKASGLAVAVTCTSGTAAANLHPAVVEAHEARVPLIVLTADRPPELRDVGAGQAIDQLGLYGSAAKWFVEVGNGEPGRAWAVHMRALACRAWWTAAGGRPGPVHLNLPLREPLAPEPEGLDPADWEGRADGRPWVELREHPPAPDGDDVQALAERIAAAPRGAVVCGGQAGVSPRPDASDRRAGPGVTADDGLGAGRAGPGASGEAEARQTGAPAGMVPEAHLAEAAARLAAAAGWPLLAEPTSGVRRGEHDRSHVIAHYDVLLGDPAFAERMRPDMVLRLGDTPTSKPLRAWLAGAPQVAIDPHVAWHEPTRTAETIVRADPARTCDALAGAVEARPRDRPRDGDGTDEAHPGHGSAPGAGASPADDWLSGWRRADATVPPALEELPEPCEPGAYAALADALPDGALVWASSSMPIRHLEAFLPQSARPLRFLSNRGANGIDGVIASAAGAARATGAPTFVLIGDVALVHDLGGLLAARRAGIDLTVVCTDNGGGAIFDLLPVAEHADPDAYERHVATPTGIDVAAVAALAGVDHRRADDAESVARAATSGPGLVELRVDRADAAAALRSLRATVAERLREAEPQ